MIDNDPTRSTFGGVVRRGFPEVDPVAVERFWTPAAGTATRSTSAGSSAPAPTWRPSCGSSSTPASPRTYSRRTTRGSTRRQPVVAAVLSRAAGLCRIPRSRGSAPRRWNSGLGEGGGSAGSAASHVTDVAKPPRRGSRGSAQARRSHPASRPGRGLRGGERDAAPATWEACSSAVRPSGPAARAGTSPRRSPPAARTGRADGAYVAGDLFRSAHPDEQRARREGGGWRGPSYGGAGGPGPEPPRGDPPIPGPTVERAAGLVHGTASTGAPAAGRRAWPSTSACCLPGDVVARGLLRVTGPAWTAPASRPARRRRGGRGHGEPPPGSALTADRISGCAAREWRGTPARCRTGRGGAAGPTRRLNTVGGARTSYAAVAAGATSGPCPGWRPPTATDREVAGLDCAWPARTWRWLELDGRENHAKHRRAGESVTAVCCRVAARRDGLRADRMAMHRIGGQASRTR